MRRLRRGIPSFSSTRSLIRAIVSSISVDVVVHSVRPSSSCFAGEDEALLVGRDALLVLDLLLHVVDRVRGGSTSSVMVLPVSVLTKISSSAATAPGCRRLQSPSPGLSSSSRPRCTYTLRAEHLARVARARWDVGERPAARMAYIEYPADARVAPVEAATRHALAYNSAEHRTEPKYAERARRLRQTRVLGWGCVSHRRVRAARPARGRLAPRPQPLRAQSARGDHRRRARARGGLALRRRAQADRADARRRRPRPRPPPPVLARDRPGLRRPRPPRPPRGAHRRPGLVRVQPRRAADARVAHVCAPPASATTGSRSTPTSRNARPGAYYIGVFGLHASEFVLHSACVPKAVRLPKAPTDFFPKGYLEIQRELDACAARRTQLRGGQTLRHTTRAALLAQGHDEATPNARGARPGDDPRGRRASAAWRTSTPQTPSRRGSASCAARRPTPPPPLRPPPRRRRRRRRRRPARPRRPPRRSDPHRRAAARARRRVAGRAPDGGGGRAPPRMPRSPARGGGAARAHEAEQEPPPQRVCDGSLRAASAGATCPRARGSSSRAASTSRPPASRSRGEIRAQLDALADHRPSRTRRDSPRCMPSTRCRRSPRARTVRQGATSIEERRGVSFARRRARRSWS